MKKLIFCISFFIVSSLAFAQSVDFTITPVYYTNGITKWTVKLSEASPRFNEVQKVVYYLDGTLNYKDPIRSSNNRELFFESIFFGTKEMTVDVEVYYKNGKRESQTLLLLNQQNKNLNLENTAQKINEDYWRWTAYITGDANTIRKIAYVEYRLHETFRQPVRIIKEIGEIDEAFPLTVDGWGIFKLIAIVHFKDGTNQMLTHILKFNSKIKIDVFYLENSEKRKELAENLVSIINTSKKYTAKTRVLTESLNKAPEYSLIENEIRYDDYENEYADELLSIIQKNGFKTKINKALIDYESFEYLRIFIVSE
ncbi:MAG: hypothetical protein POELPBGB_01337 [Bacteroidia bacterium]|nr:hypothetical protein [Bacteroidia bacterium]